MKFQTRSISRIHATEHRSHRWYGQRYNHVLNAVGTVDGYNISFANTHAHQSTAHPDYHVAQLGVTVLFSCYPIDL